MKIFIKKIRKSLSSRRNFLKSTSLFVTGMSVGKPLSLFKTKVLFEREYPLSFSRQENTVRLPEGVEAVWDLDKAYRESSATREKICINGLWQYQPGASDLEIIPEGGWGYFKVPGSWHNSADTVNENQRLYAHPGWKEEMRKDVTVSWFRRELIIPANWKDRRIILSMKYINSNAIVFIDDRKAGEIWFPAGEIDLTQLCKPGTKYILTIKVRAVPLRDVMTAYSDTNMGRQVQPTVARRGICGDVYLLGIPKGPVINSVIIETSVRMGEITFKTGMTDFVPGKNTRRYRLRIQIFDKDTKIAEFTSNTFSANDLKEGRLVFTEKWMPSDLWDIHTPDNQLQSQVSLIDASGKLVDAALPVSFGFREFWIDGRDFYLNGKRIWLACIPLDNAQAGVALASYEGARMSLQRLKDTGINFVYTHNYDSEPGSHISFDEILKAADDTGMLIALSQPHFSAYDWDSPGADENNGYAYHAGFYTRVAGNHPSVVFYSTSHNATGYVQDMNPEHIGELTRMEGQYPNRNVPKALRAEAIIRKLDPGRIVYHHSSGNLSSMYVCNFYGNWIPLQEMNEWFGNWSRKGKLPALLVEYATPFTWDYGMYRGWYKGKREFGRAQVPWEFCLAEWNSQFIGDKAYSISEYEKANLRWEAAKFRKGEVWGRSDYPYSFDAPVLDERNLVLAEHHASNWRAFRTWGLSGANSMWHYTQYWRLKKNVERKPVSFTTDWENLQKPGFSPDFINRQRERFDMGYSMEDWEETIAGKAIADNQGPLLAYIGGKSENFTDKSHNFLPGQSFEKQLIIVNNSRETIQCECRWTLNLPEPLRGTKSVSVPTGQQERIPVNFNLPINLAPGQYEIKAEFSIDRRPALSDSFNIHVLPRIGNPVITANIALFDPKGETAKLLDSLGVKYRSVEADSDFKGVEILVIGKEALSPDGPGPDVSAVRDGLKVVVFEQTSKVLEQRFGFRVQEYGLRKVFKRIADHPVLNNIDEEHLRDWQGEATILSPVLEGAPEYKWCDISVPRAWRCGTRGSVASVLIEKPACGNFLPVIDGGFSQQYSQIMEFRDGRGMILFCQLDLTGRTEEDPAAEIIAKNIFSYLESWKPSAVRRALYAGDPVGQDHLEKASVSFDNYTGGKLQVMQALIVGPGAGQLLEKNKKHITKWLKAGGEMFMIGSDQAEINILFPEIQLKKTEHISAFFGPFELLSPFAGIAPADAHNRAPAELPLVLSGAVIAGNGVMARTENSGITLCQLVPWKLDYSNEQHNVKQTFRRWSFLLSRILGNVGVQSSTPLLERFSSPTDKAKDEKRWLNSFYLDIPEEWDDPYRFFRW